METAASELNLGALLPNIGTVVGLIELLLWLAILAGPLTMLGFGLLYRYKPPKEANYGIGYRFWWGMASLDAWKYTQRLAGIIWTLLGGALSVIMLIVCIILQVQGTMTLAVGAVICLLCELVLVAAACITINIIVMRKFDKEGYSRTGDN